MTIPRFFGAHAVVTGAGSGIGRGIALALAAEGADVVLADVDVEGGERVAAEVEATGRQAVFVRTDVSDLEQVRALADAAFRTFGTIEILVNNAGVALRPFRTSWETSPEDLRWVLGINLWGVFHGHLAFVPRMVEATGFRHIVNTSSVSNVIDSDGAAAYAASKGAVAAFSIAAAAELVPSGIGMTILMPGHVSTALADSERLRPESERSSSRDITPYDNSLSRFVKGTDGQATDDAPTSVDLGVYTPLDPIDVGRRTVEAIVENELFCLTHLPAVDGMRDRVEKMIKSYRAP